MNTTNVHQGRNVRRFREMRELKQEGLAHELGGDWTQKRISLLEQREVIDISVLREVADALKVPVEALEKMNDESAVYNISCNYTSSAVNQNSVVETQNINPIEKIGELYEEKNAVYERMLKDKDDMIGELKKLLERR